MRRRGSLIHVPLTGSSFNADDILEASGSIAALSSSGWGLTTSLS